MTGPLVSIIIPCHNAAPYVGQAIGSALQQTYLRREVIVVDDGSRDDSLKVIRSFGNQIRWETGPNCGGCVARNRGVELARGEFIQFLDADDALFSQKLEVQVPISRAHSEFIVYCDHIAFWECSEREPEVRSATFDNRIDPVVFVLRHKALQTSAPLYRREWLTAVGGFRPGLRASQEFDLNLRLAGWGERRWLHLPEVLFKVRRRSESVSSHTGRALACLIDVLPAFHQDLMRRGRLSEERRQEIARYTASVARLCAREGERAAGLRLLEFAEQVDRSSALRSAYSLPSRIVRELVGASAVEYLAETRKKMRLGLRQLTSNK